MKDLQQQLIIIPDVHGRYFWRDAVRMNPEARFVFLGDYLDPYPWEGVTVGEACCNLQDIVAFKEAHPDRVTVLWGNHDLHYLYPDLGGCRYDYVNGERNARFFDEHKALFGLAWETEVAGKRFLFSHAGVGRQWLRRNASGKARYEWPGESWKELTEGFERAILAQALAANGGNLAATARALKTTPRIVAYKTRKYELEGGKVRRWGSRKLGSWEVGK